MFIKKVEVKNFRSIRDECLYCDNLTALVGRNGSGKSSFLYALEVFYDPGAPVSIEDFFDRDDNSSIEIRVTYYKLRDDEKEEFSPYIKDDKLIVTKRISIENGRPIQRYYAAIAQIPQFAEIRLKSGRERISAWTTLVSNPGEFTNLGGKAKSTEQVELRMTEYESNHPEFTQPIEKIEQFFGSKNVGGGKLDKFTKYVLVPAVREASDEATGRKGVIFQILDTIVLRKINARNDIQDFKTEFDKKARELYSSTNLTELFELGDSISVTLEKFAPGSRLKLDWDEFDPPEVMPPPAKTTLIEDNFEGDINRKGHGLQRALILTLLQYLATMAPSVTSIAEHSSEEGNNLTSKVPKLSRGPDLILAIEEPELYLHPSRCRYLSDLLLQLSENLEDTNTAGNQIIYATHSPYFIDLPRLDQIRIIRKESSTESPVPMSIVKSYTLDQAAQEMAEICNADPVNFTRDTFQARAMPIMNTIVNEGFFADVVVVVEGLSEVGILWKLQEIMEKDWAKLGIAIIPADSKNNIDRPVVIFRGLSIPTYFIFDADSKHKGGGNKEEDDAKKYNRSYLRLGGVQPEDFPDTQAHEIWAVFEDNLERELEKTLDNRNIQALRSQVASELGYPEAARAIKNVNGAARFIELAYENGNRIPILEEIIEKITLLRK